MSYRRGHTLTLWSSLALLRLVPRRLYFPVAYVRSSFILFSSRKIILVLVARLGLACGKLRLAF